MVPALVRDAEVVPEPRLGSDGSNIPVVLGLWRGSDPERSDKLQEFVRRCLPELRHVLVKPSPASGQQRLWVQQTDGEMFDAGHVSDGVLCFIALAMHAIEAEPGSVLFVEEPEQCVHPRRIEMIVNLFRQIVTEHGCQIIVVTHSPTLLDEFRDRPKKLALVVASHPHADHIGSMQWVLETFDVDVYVDNGQKFDSALWAKLDKVRRRQVSDAEITYVAGKKTGFADLAFCPQVGVRLLVPWAVRELSNTNDRSVVVSLTYGKTSFLFGGDAEEHAEEVMVNDFEPGEREHLRVMVLKAGHHGSDTSSTLPFIAAVNPKTVVVSSGKKEVGTNARYKHPRHSTMQNYNNWLRNHDEGEPSSQPGRVWAYDKPGKRWRQIERRRGLWVTPEDGTVVMLSDGEKIEIRTEKTGAQVSVSP